MPSPLTDTIVNAANNVIITPTTNAVGMIANVRRLSKWCPKVRAFFQIEEKTQKNGIIIKLFFEKHCFQRIPINS